MNVHPNVFDVLEFKKNNVHVKMKFAQALKSVIFKIIS